MGKIKKVISLVRDYGVGTAFHLTMEKIKSNPAIQKKKAVALIKKSMAPDVLKSEKDNQPNREVKVSILTPVYNTEVSMLKCVIESVLNQTYQNIELCITDASDSEHAVTSEICKKYASMDSRIVYRKLDSNKGISANTNAAFDISTGQMIALLDHDDILHPSAVYHVVSRHIEEDADFIYTDEVTFEGSIDNILSTNFKPDYSPDTLRANNYICHFTCFTRKLLERTGIFNERYDGSQDHDLFLRLTDKADKVSHIPELLYFWRAHKGSVVSDINAKNYAIEAGKNAVRDFLFSKGINAQVSSTDVYPTIYKIDYELKTKPKISIIILNKDHAKDLRRCVESINKSDYKNYEIIIVENNSVEPETEVLYKELSADDKIRILHCDRPFNYSEFNNEGVKEAAGEYLLFLNNDTEVINEKWLTEMLMFAQRKDVGAVGARLFYPDGRLQHCFVVTGTGEDHVATHAGLGLARNDYGYLDRIGFNQNVSAVTGACLMVRKDAFTAVEGFDENLSVAYNDVDLCLKLREKKYLNIYTPFATLYHYESASRGNDWNKDNRARLLSEAKYMKDKWGDRLSDPYYNKNFSLEKLYTLR